MQRHVEAGIYRQIESVQIIELHPELTAQTGAGNLQALVVVDLGHRRGLQEITERILAFSAASISGGVIIPSCTNSRR